MTAFFPKSPKPIESSVKNLRCPICRHAGAFHGFQNCHDVTWGETQRMRPNRQTQVVRNIAGMRRCPNPDCGAIAFIIVDTEGRLYSFPPEVIDFDATDLPANILSSLEEAIACHAASAYRASALMVRRVLEEVCDDKAAVGKNLKERIAGLSAVAVIPVELISAADELRILGNDAAHVEAKDYDAIGKEEAEIAIDLAKELLKAVYQYTSLVARLKALKKPANP